LTGRVESIGALLHCERRSNLASDGRLVREELRAGTAYNFL
jgi:hypothetical protein